jgi:hypothetical protein
MSSFRPDGDRVDATAGPIQHLSLAELDQDDLVQPIPNPGILPLPQSSPRGVSGPAAQLLRQVAPTATGAEHEHDPFQRGTIIDPWPPPWTLRWRPFRDQWLYQFPEPIIDQAFLPSRHHIPDDPRSEPIRPGSTHHQF